MKIVRIPDNEVFKNCVHIIPETAEERAQLEAEAVIVVAKQKAESYVPTKRWWQFWR